MNRSMSGLPVHHQLPKFTQTYVHRVGDVNLVLENAEEETDGAVSKFATLIVRGDNVIYISPSVN